MAAIRSSIALKIFGVALGLLILMAIVALLNLRMTRTVDAQLVVIDENYVPAVATLAQAQIHKLEESSTSRRLASELLDGDRSSPDYTKSIEGLRRRVQEAGNWPSGSLPKPGKISTTRSMTRSISTTMSRSRASTPMSSSCSRSTSATASFSPAGSPPQRRETVRMPSNGGAG